MSGAPHSLHVRFVSGKGWDSKVIEWYSRCEWSHVELLFGNVTFGAQLRGGVKWRKLGDPCYARAVKTETWEIPLTEEEHNVMTKLITDAFGTKYDWPAILSFMLGPHRLHLPGAYICSGFVAGLLGGIGKLAINLPIENYDPRDLWVLVPQIRGARKL
jgi:hypothetical protein